MNAGDTAWMLIATGLVLFMTPGLALFYGGMVRTRNVLGMLMQNFFTHGPGERALGPGRVTRLAFGGCRRRVHRRPATSPGSRQAVVTRHPGPWGSLTFPVLLFVAYQMMFAVITPALITGATADRLQVRRLGSCSSAAVDDARLLPGRPLGLLTRRMARSSVASSTSPAERSCTSTPAWPRWPSSCVLGQASRAGRTSRCHPHSLPLHPARHRHPLVRLVRLQRRLGPRTPTAWPLRRLLNTQLAAAAAHARLDRCSSGSRDGASRRPWAARPARSPVWWRSRPARATSTPMAPIVIGCRGGRSCATWPSASKFRFRLRRRPRRHRRPPGRRACSARSCSGCSPTKAVNPAGANGLFYGGGCAPPRPAGHGRGRHHRLLVQPHLAHRHVHRQV